MKRLRLPRPIPHEAGLTLAELLVTMLVFSIVTTLILALVVSSVEAGEEQEAHQDSTREAALGMQRLGRALHATASISDNPFTAPPPAFQTATRTAFTVTALLDAESAVRRPTRIEVSFDATSSMLTERRFRASGSSGNWVFPPTPTASFTLARNVDPSREPLFEYLRSDGQAIAAPAAGVAADALADIAAVRVRLRIQAEARGVTVSSLVENTFGLPNLERQREVVGP